MGSETQAREFLMQKDVDKLAAVLHLSGSLRDGLFQRLQLEDLEATFAPKVHGLQALQQDPWLSDSYVAADFFQRQCFQVV